MNILRAALASARGDERVLRSVLRIRANVTNSAGGNRFVSVIILVKLDSTRREAGRGGLYSFRAFRRSVYTSYCPTGTALKPYTALRTAVPYSQSIDSMTRCGAR